MSPVKLDVQLPPDRWEEALREWEESLEKALGRRETTRRAVVKELARRALEHGGHTDQKSHGRKKKGPKYIPGTDPHLMLKPAPKNRGAVIEIENALQKEFPHTAFLLGSNPVTAQMVAEEHRRLAKRFPKTAASIALVDCEGALASIGGAGVSGMSLGNYHGDHSKGILMIDKVIMDSTADSIVDLFQSGEVEVPLGREGGKTTWMTAGTHSFKGNYAHEFGHHVTFQLIRSGDKGTVDMMAWEEAVKERAKDHPLSEVLPSGYAVSHPMEALAECFTQFVNERKQGWADGTFLLADVLHSNRAVL